LVAEIEESRKPGGKRKITIRHDSSNSAGTGHGVMESDFDEHFHGTVTSIGKEGTGAACPMRLSPGKKTAIIAYALAVALAGPLPACAQHSTATWGQILIAGGPYDGGVDLYDPASNRFAPEIGTPRMRARVRATATLLVTGPNAGKVLIAGGENKNAVPRASTELYDPASNTVADGPSMKSPRTCHTATTIPTGPNSGKILFAGGMGAFTHGDLSSTELYDPVTNTFSPGPAMRTGCALCTAMVITSGKNSGKILINDSYDAHGVLGSTEFYDPVANAFTPGPIMHPACFVVTATLIPSGKNAGKILFVGCEHLGNPGNNDSTELYDPASDKFVEGPAIKSAREAHTATAFASGPNTGKILIAGGEHDDSDEKTGRDASLASTELYDPATQHHRARPGDEQAPYRAYRDGNSFGKKCGQDSDRRRHRKGHRQKRLRHRPQALFDGTLRSSDQHFCTRPHHEFGSL
jgi:hypothetical protein